MALTILEKFLFLNQYYKDTIFLLTKKKENWVAMFLILPYYSAIFYSTKLIILPKQCTYNLFYQHHQQTQSKHNGNTT